MVGGRRNNSSEDYLEDPIPAELKPWKKGKTLYINVANLKPDDLYKCVAWADKFANKNGLKLTVYSERHTVHSAHAACINGHFGKFKKQEEMTKKLYAEGILPTEKDLASAIYLMDQRTKIDEESFAKYYIDHGVRDLFSETKYYSNNPQQESALCLAASGGHEYILDKMLEKLEDILEDETLDEKLRKGLVAQLKLAYDAANENRSNPEVKEKIKDMIETVLRRNGFVKDKKQSFLSRTFGTEEARWKNMNSLRGAHEPLLGGEPPKPKI